MTIPRHDLGRNGFAGQPKFPAHVIFDAWSEMRKGAHGARQLAHGSDTPCATQPFERTLHGFTWLRDLLASAPRAQCAATAERVLVAWLDAFSCAACHAA